MAAQGNTPGGRPADDTLVYSVAEAGRLLGLSRNSSYLAAQNGSLPVVRVGGRIFVPKHALHVMLDVTAERQKTV